MTKAHTMRRLIALGPLRLLEIVEITRWSYREVRTCISYLRDRGEIAFSKLSKCYVMTTAKENF